MRADRWRPVWGAHDDERLGPEGGVICDGRLVRAITLAELRDGGRGRITGGGRSRGRERVLRPMRAIGSVVGPWAVGADGCLALG